MLTGKCIPSPFPEAACIPLLGVLHGYGPLELYWAHLTRQGHRPLSESADEQTSFRLCGEQDVLTGSGD